MNTYDISLIASAPLVKSHLDGIKSETRRLPTVQLMRAWQHLGGGGAVRFWHREHITYEAFDGDCCRVRYHADNTVKTMPVDRLLLTEWRAGRDAWPHTASRSPIHMHQWASRFTSIVTALDIERVQDITDDGAIAEGIRFLRTREAEGWSIDPDARTLHASAVAAFEAVWRTLHPGRKKSPDETWDANPEVFVIRYDLIPTNITQLNPDRIAA